jgi:large subunit ribosomal protein L35
MPKFRSNSAARKRFRVTCTGKVTHRKANNGHFRIKKKGGRGRRLAVTGTLSRGDRRLVRKMLPDV